MQITISVPEKRKDIMDKVEWAVNVRGMAKSKFVCNAIDYYYHYLQSGTDTGTGPEHYHSPAPAVSEAALRTLIREVMNEKDGDKSGTSPPKTKKPSTKKATVKEVEVTPVPPKSSLLSEVAAASDELDETPDWPTELSQEEQELFDIINAGLGLE